MKILDWNKLNDKRKKEISKLKPIFLCGPVDLSGKRIIKLINQLSSKKHLLFGTLKDEFIPGLEGSVQFKSLELKNIENAMDNERVKIENVTLLEYYQRDWDYILKELNFSAVILVNGSWSKQIHLRKEMWSIIEKKVPYKFISRFENEEEAKEFASKYPSNQITKSSKIDSDDEIFKIVDSVAKKSFDWTFQTGAVLVKDNKIIASSYNKVVPYETYAMHFGSIREKNFTPINDQNHYDTNHAEVELLIESIKNKLDLKDSTLFINLMPCPTCARMLSQTEIKEIVYKLDHSDGYAIKLLTDSGKIVRRA